MMHEHVRTFRSSGGQIAVAFRHLRLVTCSPDLSVTCGHLDAVDGKVRKHSKEATRALELVSADALGVSGLSRAVRCYFT